jgi:NAD(P)H-dependent FMN reductase
VVAGALLVLVAGFGVPPAPVDDPSSLAWLVPLLLLTPFLGAPFPALQLDFCHLASVRRHFGAGVAAARIVASPAPAPEESPVTNTTRILAFAGSAREASLNKKLVRVAAEGARAAGAEVTLIDLRDLPMPIYDGDLEEAEGLPPNARELKRLLREHDGLLLACPEYNSSITPLLKNAIDWASRAEEGEKPLACFKGKVAGLLAASPGGLGGLRGLVTVRSILGNIGVLVIPEQVVVPKAAEVFDEQGRLASDKQRASVERIGRRVAEVAGQLSPRAG